MSLRRIFTAGLFIGIAIQSFGFNYRHAGLYNKHIDAKDSIIYEIHRAIVNRMNYVAETIQIDGRDYLLAYPPLEVFDSPINLQAKDLYRDILPFYGPPHQSSFYSFWGNGNAELRHWWSWWSKWSIVNKRLYMISIEYKNMEDNIMKVYRVNEQSEDIKRQFYEKMMNFTECKFDKLQRLFFKTFSGIIYVKAVNTNPEPQQLVGKYGNKYYSPEDMDVLLQWEREPIYRLCFKNGILESMTPLGIIN